MAKAFVFMRKKVVVYASDETIEQLAKDYETAMKEAAEAISKANKWKKRSEETRRKMSEAQKNMSEETRRKLSESHKGQTAWDKGKKLSEEHKKKLSEAHKWKHRSEETKKKIGEAKKGTLWYNNGEISIRAKECPDGFVPGRIK